MPAENSPARLLCASLRPDRAAAPQEERDPGHKTGPGPSQPGVGRPTFLLAVNLLEPDFVGNQPGSEVGQIDEIINVPLLVRFPKKGVDLGMGVDVRAVVPPVDFVQRDFHALGLLPAWKAIRSSVVHG